MGFLNLYTSSSDLRSTQNCYDTHLKIYNEKIDKIRELLGELYSTRKIALSQLQKVKDYVNQTECYPYHSQGIDLALSQAALFKDATLQEIQLGTICGKLRPHMAVAFATALREEAGKQNAGIEHLRSFILRLTANCEMVDSEETERVIVSNALTGGLVISTNDDRPWAFRNRNLEIIKTLIKEGYTISEKIFILEGKQAKLRTLVAGTRKLSQSVDTHMITRADQLDKVVDTCKTLGKILNDTISIHNL